MCSYMYDAIIVPMTSSYIPWAERRRLAERLHAEYGHRPGIPCFFMENHPDGFAHRGLPKWGHIYEVPKPDRTAMYAWVGFPGDLEITILDPSKPLVAENLVLACRSCSRRLASERLFQRDQQDPPKDQ